LDCGIGIHELHLELVEQNVTYFTDQGVKPLQLTLVVEPATLTRSAALYERAARITPWHYQPNFPHDRPLMHGSAPVQSTVSRVQGFRCRHVLVSGAIVLPALWPRQSVAPGVS
jgi:hypothetical protein